MKKNTLIFIIAIVQFSATGNAQSNEFGENIKEVKLKKTDYSILIPGQYRIIPTYGVDFLGYAINRKEKNHILDYKSGYT